LVIISISALLKAKIPQHYRKGFPLVNRGKQKKCKKVYSMAIKPYIVRDCGGVAIA
jgi:hypothetical protein